MRLTFILRPDEKQKKVKTLVQLHIQKDSSLLITLILPDLEDYSLNTYMSYKLRTAAHIVTWIRSLAGYFI